MQAKLIVVRGKASKREIDLKLPTTVGRSKATDLTVAHPMISRRHCELFEMDGLLMIRDLGSLNGTIVGGERIEQTALAPDDEFSIGPLTFRAEYQYSGDLDAVLSAKATEDEQASSGEEDPRLPAADEPTPYDPYTLTASAEEHPPAVPFRPRTETDEEANRGDYLEGLQ